VSLICLRDSMIRQWPGSAHVSRSGCRRALSNAAFKTGNCSSGSGRGSVMGLGAVAHGWA